MSVALLESVIDPGAFSLRLNTVQRAFGSPYGGGMQVVDLLNDWWTATVTLPPSLHDDAAQLEAWVNALRGMTQVVNLHHLARPEPFGTLRGTPESWGAVRGARELRVTGTYGQTLNAGDMIGVEGLLLQVAETVAFVETISGVPGCAYVPLVNSLRKAVVGGVGSAVVWDRPTAPFRLVSQPAVQYVPGYAEGLTLDFMEDVTL